MPHQKVSEVKECSDGVLDSAPCWRGPGSAGVFREMTSGAELAEVLQKLLAGRAIKSCGK